MKAFIQEKTIDDVKEFWDSHPLFAGELSFPVGSREYFEEQHAIYVKDVFAGRIDRRIFPDLTNNDNVLDLGCGPGLWAIELLKNGARQVTAADLSETAVALTRKRAHIYGVRIQTCLQNAENMTFADGIFSHVNCQGVIHHTPNTESCVKEIARVLRINGSALISVYFKNIFLRLWPMWKYPAKILSAMGAGMKGRGREAIYAVDDIKDLVKLYDGNENPIGKMFSKDEFVKMLSPYLSVEDIFYHYFPARSLPFRLPYWLHGILDKKAGFLIFAKCRKL